MCERKKRDFFWLACLSSASICCFSLNVTFLSSEVFLHWDSCPASSLPIFLHKTQWRHGTYSFTPWRPVSTLHLQLTTPVWPPPLCSRKGVAHHHAYTKIWSLVHRWSCAASAHKHTEAWDTPKWFGITVLRNSYSLLLVLVKSKRCLDSMGEWTKRSRMAVP